MEKTLHVYVDIVHPLSGEVLAENNDVLDVQTARAKHILSIAEAYPDHYFVYYGDNFTAVYDGPTVF